MHYLRQVSLTDFHNGVLKLDTMSHVLLVLPQQLHTDTAEQFTDWGAATLVI